MIQYKVEYNTNAIRAYSEPMGGDLETCFPWRMSKPIYTIVVTNQFNSECYILFQNAIILTILTPMQCNWLQKLLFLWEAEISSEYSFSYTAQCISSVKLASSFCLLQIPRSYWWQHMCQTYYIHVIGLPLDNYSYMQGKVPQLAIIVWSFMSVCMCHMEIAFRE